MRRLLLALALVLTVASSAVAQRVDGGVRVNGALQGTPLNNPIFTGQWTVNLVLCATGTVIQGGSPTTCTATPTVTSLTTSQSIGATSTDGLVSTNTTAATVGAQKWAPRLHFSGNGWQTGTGGSQVVDWIFELQPRQASASAVPMFAGSYQINGGGYNQVWRMAAPGIDATDVFQIDSTGSSGTGLLSTNQKALQLFANMGTSGAGQAVAFDIVSGGSCTSCRQTGMGVNITAGYTGTARTVALISGNTAASTGTNPSDYASAGDNYTAGNIGQVGFTTGVTVGTNTATLGDASGGDKNYGGFFQAVANKANARNIGSFGMARNTSSGGVATGGFFAIAATGNTPPIQPQSAAAALVADNTDSGSPIALFRSAAVTLASVGATGIVDAVNYTVAGTAITSGVTHLTSGSGMAVANVGANSCGTTTATIAGNNNASVTTVGATAGTQCRIAFTFAASTEWDCAANDDTTTTAVRTTPVDTTHTDLIGTFTAGDKVTAICFPR